MPEVDPNQLDANLDEVDEVSFEAVPPGTYVCRLTVSSVEPIGKSADAKLGLKVKARVVEENYHGSVIRDSLFWSKRAMGRIKAAVHRLAGVEGGIVTAAEVRDWLNGKLARVTVDKIDSFTGKDGTIYRDSKVAFSGYAAPSAEEIQRYGTDAPVAANGTKDDDDLPF